MNASQYKDGQNHTLQQTNPRTGQTEVLMCLGSERAKPAGWDRIPQKDSQSNNSKAS